jgi:rubrerythrin
MARDTEVGPIDTRAVLDLAIMVEEDAALRYAELARLIGDDPGGAGDVCREMAAREQDDRERLATQRARLRGGAPARVDVSAMGLRGEGPGGPGGAVPATARAALEEALAGERRAEAFYAALAGRSVDRATDALLESLRAEEEHHAHLLARKIAELDAADPVAGLPCADPALLPDDAPPARASADPALLASVLPRFDQATQAIARSLLVEGRTPEAVAWDLGVTRRTVLRKLRQFLDAAPATLVIDRGGAYATAARTGPYAPR